MKYCCHCGYKLNEEKVEHTHSSHKEFQEIAPASAEVEYVCPRCGRLIHENVQPDEIRSLSRACHAELQRGRNDVARGMSSLILFIIAIIIAIVFLMLANKINGSGRSISTACAEFWVFVALTIVSIVLLGFAIYRLTLGLKRQVIYSKLLKDINNETFVQQLFSWNKLNKKILS